MVSSVWLVLICFCLWFWLPVWVVCPSFTILVFFCEPAPLLLAAANVLKRSWVLDYQERCLLLPVISLLLSKIFSNPSRNVWYFLSEKHSSNAWSPSALYFKACYLISWHLRSNEEALEPVLKSLVRGHHLDEVSLHCEYFNSCDFW